jgi:hypothetical protein
MPDVVVVVDGVVVVEVGVVVVTTPQSGVISVCPWPGAPIHPLQLLARP